MPPVRALLFDFHETLVSADRWMAFETGGLATAIPQRLGLLSNPVSPDEVRRIEQAYARVRALSAGAGIEFSAGQVGRIVLRALGHEAAVPDVALETAIDNLFREYVPDVTVKPGAPAGLADLARLGCRMGIVSNAAHTGFLRWALDAHGLGHYFERLTVSADLGMRKPRREIFDAALAAMGLRAGETAYAGNDYVKDVMGAKLAGLRAIWMPGGRAEDYRVYTTVHPDAVVTGFSDLVAIVQTWMEEA